MVRIASSHNPLGSLTDYSGDIDTRNDPVRLRGLVDQDQHFAPLSQILPAESTSSLYDLGWPRPQWHFLSFGPCRRYSSLRSTKGRTLDLCRVKAALCTTRIEPVSGSGHLWCYQRLVSFIHSIDTGHEAARF